MDRDTYDEGERTISDWKDVSSEDAGLAVLDTYEIDWRSERIRLCRSIKARMSYVSSVNEDM